MLEILTWCLSIVLMIAGLIGVVLPLIPGTLLIFSAAIVHHLLIPQEVSWTTVGVVGALWILSIIVEVAGMAVGTRWFGGSKWGMAGASGGALVGVFFSLPMLILGTVVGAIIAEKFVAKRTDGAALKAGFGAAAGFALSIAARLVCALTMIATFLFAALRS